MKVDRRVFLAGLGGAGLGVGIGGLSHLFPLSSPEVGADWSPGEEGFVPSTCLLCPSHCGIVGRVIDGLLVNVNGNPLHPVSRGGLCPKGKASTQLLYHPSRLRGALERTGAPGSTAFQPIEWDAALARVVAELRKLLDRGQPRAAAWIVGHVEGSLGQLLQRFVDSFGSPHLIREDYGDGSDEVMALTQGIQARPAFDLDQADLVLSFGAPLAEAWWCLPQAARARDFPPERRRHWIQIDTRLSRTAAAADEWLPVKPGSFGALALAIAYVMLKEGLYESDWVRDGVSGYGDWMSERGRAIPGYRSLVLRHGRPDDLAERIGLSGDRIVRLAKSFGRSRRPVAIWDQVVAWRRGGLADALAIHALNVLAGSIHRPGGVYVQPDLPPPTNGPLGPATTGKGPDVQPLRGHDWADRMLESDRSPIEVLFLLQSNPVASAPEPEKVRRALERIPLVISFSPFLDESARHAHLVLPDHTYLERWQDATAPPSVPYPVWGLVQPLVPPLHDTRATGDVLLALASGIGGPVSRACPWSSMEQLVTERGKSLAQVERGATFVEPFRRSELQALEARGWWIPHGQSPDRFWKSLRETGGWFDPFHEDITRAGASQRPDQRVALFPEEARWKIGGGMPGLREGFLPLPGAETAKVGEGVEAEGAALLLNPYRLMTLSSGTTTLMPWLLERIGPMTETAWEAWVEVNPHTGRTLGFVSGQRVRVIGERGTFTARLRFYKGAQPGVLNAPYGLHSQVAGWGVVEPANPLAAIGGRRDPITGMPDWYTTEVRLEAV